MIGRSVKRLLLQAARHAVVQARVGQQLRMDAAADHCGELVVCSAEIGPEETADVCGVAFQSCVMLVQTRVMMMVRRHQRMQIFVVLLLRATMVDGRTGLLGARRDVVSGWTVLAGDGRARRHCHRSRRLMLLMLLMLVGLSGYLFLLVLEPLLASQITTVLKHIAAVRVQRPK